MNKQDILNQRRKKLLKRIEESAEGRAYLAERNDPTGTGLYVDSVKKMQMEEIAKVEKIMDSISRVNESAAVLKEIRSMHGIIKELAEKKIPAPVVNYQPAEIRVKVPEPTVINNTKTEVLVETKYQEKTADTLDEAVKVLKEIAKSSDSLQVARIKNAVNDAIPVQIVDKRGKSIMDFSDIPAFMQSSSGGSGAQYTEGDVKTTTVGTMMMWKSGSTVTAASTATPMPVTVIGGGTSGTQYTEDAAAASDPVGTVVNLVRKDTPAAITSADGDNIAQRGTNYGAGYVQVVTSAGAFVDTFGGGTQYADGAARSTATGTLSMVDDGTLIQAMKGDSSGRPLVTIDTALPAGTSIIGKFGIDQTTPGTTNKVSIGTDGTVGVTGSVAVTGTFYQATQPVSIASTVAVSGPLTDAQLRASAVPVSAASLPLPSGAATSANQTTIIGHVDGIEALLTTIDADTSVLSAAVSANKVQVDVITMPTTTVTGTVAATQSGTWTVQPGNTPNTTPWLFSIHDGTTKATVRELGTNDALNVAIVDGSGNQITSFGGGTQYAEDDAAAANPTGTAEILVRQDTPSALVSADGDNVARRGTNYGAAYTQIVTSTGSYVDTFGGGTQYTEGDTDATITGTAMMYETTGNVLTPAFGSTSGGIVVDLGANNDVTVTGSVAVTGTFYQATQPVSIASSVTVDSELPAAATLADATTNPSTTSVGSLGHVFNGTTWDRAKSGTTTPSSTFTGMQNTMPWAKYDATPTARTTGQGGPLQADTNGALNVNSYTLQSGEDQTNNVMQVTQKPLAVSTYSATRYVNIATSASAAVKTSTGNIFSVSITNRTASVQYLQLFNQTTAPTSGSTVPVYSFPVSIGPGTMTVIGNDFFTNAGINFTSGISFGVSSTDTVFTTGTAAIVAIHYI